MNLSDSNLHRPATPLLEVRINIESSGQLERVAHTGDVPWQYPNLGPCGTVECWDGKEILTLVSGEGAHRREKKGAVYGGRVGQEK